MESEEDEAKGLDMGGRDDAEVEVDIDDDNNDDQDNVPLSVRFEALQAQSSIHAGDVVTEDTAGARGWNYFNLAQRQRLIRSWRRKPPGWQEFSGRLQRLFSSGYSTVRGERSSSGRGQPPFPGVLDFSGSLPPLVCKAHNHSSSSAFLGSQALWDFGADLDANMGEQQRGEVESREQPSSRRSPAVDLGKGPMVAKMEVLVRLFPEGYPVDEAYHPLLDAIARRHLETFAHFNPRSTQLGAIFFKNLHEVLTF
ncbi:hypothetical protein RHMOL_Rhmol06G0142300 [Rhododendron molle]|uniref:Uncharacterized protein n=1 Tax=Rhododendron molle TaxID=49168 RepID=A0ACC0NE30_RHOML|nr:hypothetical protein RHMOL_Rhmol06G0142300 [Rhododendron molle]